MTTGWVKSYRKMEEWGWYKDVPVCLLYQHLIRKANHKDGVWKGITVKRGDLIASYNTLAQHTGLTRQQVRTAITKLKSTGEITLKATNKYSVITIVKYSSYQDIESDGNTQNNTQANSQATRKQHASNTQSNTKQEYKNVKNEKNNKEIKDMPWITTNPKPIKHKEYAGTGFDEYGHWIGDD